MDLPTHHNFKDKTGMKFGKLTVISLAGKINGAYWWNCICDCGNLSTVEGSNLNNNGRAGKTKSCGCVFRTDMAGPRVPKEERVKELENKTPFFVVDPKEGLADSKWILHCEYHGNFEANYCNIVFKGQGCPMCCKKGYQRSKPGFLYILKVEDSGLLLGYKVGITNQNPRDRAYQIDLKSVYDVEHLVSLKFSVGMDAHRLERQILDKFSEHLFDKSLMEIGHTETIGKESFGDALRMAKSYHFHKQT